MIWYWLAKLMFSDRELEIYGNRRPTKITSDSSRAE